MTTIKLKNGSGAPTAGDLAQGEPALDLTNKRLYTEDSGGTVIEVGTNPGTDVTFADNRKAVFGAGSDLQIYHDGSNSFVTDEGTGSLYLRGSSQVRVETPTGENMAIFNDNGAVSLRYNNAKKFETTSTGIDVTGTVTADGLTVESDSGVSSPTILIKDTDTSIAANQVLGKIDFEISDASNPAIQARIDAYSSTTYGNPSLRFFTGDLTGLHQYMNIAYNGDISFYEDTGTTAKLFWDASAESLGIGTSSPSSPLEVAGGSSYPTTKFSRDGGTAATQGYLTTGFSAIGYSGGTGADSYLVSEHGFGFAVNAGTNALVITDGGNVGIGTSSPSNLVHLQSSLDTLLKIESTDTVVRLDLTDSGGTSLIQNSSGKLVLQADNANTAANTYLGFEVDGSEAMRIDASGNVGIGVTPESDWSTSYHALQLGTTATFMGAASGSGEGNFISNNAIFSTSGNWEYIQTASASSLDMQAGTAPFRFRYAASGTAGTAITWSEAMRITSDGRLLIGKTSADTGVDGIQTRNDGLIACTRDGDLAGIFNRKTSDGSIVEFRKDNNAVGSIGTISSEFYIAHDSTTDSGLRFRNGIIQPCNASGGSNDAAVSLGQSSMRFSNLYLSGGAYLGGTGTANKLDDYEEGTWTPTLEGSTTAGVATYTTQTGNYTKVGRQVTVTFDVRVSGWTTSPVGSFLLNGLPFASAAITSTGSFMASKMNMDDVSITAVLYMATGTNNLRVYLTRDDATWVQQSISAEAIDMLGTITYFV